MSHFINYLSIFIQQQFISDHRITNLCTIIRFSALVEYKFYKFSIQYQIVKYGTYFCLFLPLCATQQSLKYLIGMIESTSETEKEVSQVVRNRLNQQILCKLWIRNNSKVNNLPIGVNNFVDLATKYKQFYVDKSYLIRQLFEPNVYCHKMIIISRPSGWGKSTNLSMIRYFLSKDVDKHANIIDPQPYSNIFFGGDYIMGHGENQKLIQLTPLKIGNSIDFTNQFNAKKVQGSAPVIYLNLNMNCSRIVDAKRGILNAILKCYDGHPHMKNTEKAVFYNSYKKQMIRLAEMSDGEFMKESIHTFVIGLLNIIEEYFKEDNCYLLIDDCDEPVLKVLKSKGNLHQARQVADLIYGIIHPVIIKAKTLKIIATCKVNIFQSIFADYRQLGIFEDKLYEQFGFKETEIKENLIKPLFAEKPNEKMEAYLLQKVVKNCGGYVCGRQQLAKIQPSATLKYLQLCISNGDIMKCKLHKEQFHSNWFVEEFINLLGLSNVFELLSLPPTRAEYHKALQLDNFITTKNDLLQIPQITNILYGLGFLVGKPEISQNKPRINKIAFPNIAISSALKSAVINRLGEKYSIGNFKAINIASTEDVCRSFEDMLKHFYLKQTEITNSFISGAFYYRYDYSKNKTFKTAYEYLEPNSPMKIDNVYVPKDKQEQIFILHFLYVDHHDSVENVLPQFIYGIAESTELQRALKVSQLLGNQIEEFVIRFILVMPNEQMDKLEVKSLNDSLIFNAREVQDIIKNMTDEKVKSEWDRMRRVDTLKRGMQSISILHALANAKLRESGDFDEIADIQARKKEQRFDINAIKGPVSRKYRVKSPQNND